MNVHCFAVWLFAPTGRASSASVLFWQCCWAAKHTASHLQIARCATLFSEDPIRYAWDGKCCLLALIVWSFELVAQVFSFDCNRIGSSNDASNEVGNMWYKISVQSAALTYSNTQITTFLQCLIYSPFPCMDCSSPLPSSQRKLLFLVVVVQFSLELNGLPPAASCSGTQHFVPPLLLVVMETSRPVVLSLTSIPLFATQKLRRDKKAFEQLCADRSGFLGGLRRRPAVKWHSTHIWHLTGQCLSALCLIRFGVPLKASPEADDVTKQNKLVITGSSPCYSGWWRWCSPACTLLLPSAPSFLLAWQE